MIQKDLFGHKGVPTPRYSPVAKSGDDEWYTPPEIVEIARQTMGTIDLDPASSPEANAIVQAKTYYTKEDNGMNHPWYGRVFMNPPYAGTNIMNGKRAFIAKLVKHYLDGDITEACAVCPIDFSPSWGNPLRENADAFFFSKGRLKFWKHNAPDADPQGNGTLLVYFGHQAQHFEKICQKYHPGIVLFPNKTRTK